MNVGYSNINTVDRDKELCCPLCGSNIYVNKYGIDYTCTNGLCKISGKFGMSAMGLVRELREVLEVKK